MNVNTTEYGVNIRDTVFNKVVEQSVDADFTLPDYCPEISRVLKCVTTPVVLSKSVNGTQATVDGNITFCFIYTDSDNQISSYEYSYPFSKSFELGDSVMNAEFKTKIRIDYMNVRAISERRVEFHGAVGILCIITEKKTKNIISDIDSDCVFQRSGTINAITPITAADKHIIVEEETEIGQGKPAIKCVIRKNADAVVSECKIISNKAVIKGNVMLQVLYSPNPDGRPQNFETTIPFSQVIELPDITDECKCDTKISVLSLEVDPKQGMSEECRTLSISAKLLITLDAYCDNEIPVIYDVFSGKYEVTSDMEEVGFEKIIGNINENYMCKKTLEFSDNAIGTVVDIWGDTFISGVKHTDNQAVINGTVNINILGYDSSGTPAFFERGIDFEYTFDLESAPVSFKCDPEIEVSNLSYNILDYNKIDIRAELSINAVIYDVEKGNVITDIEVNTDNECNHRQDAALILYYADCGETVWDIAKRYSASPLEIAEVNEVTEEVLSSKKVLLIP